MDRVGGRGSQRLVILPTSAGFLRDKKVEQRNYIIVFYLRTDNSKIILQ